MGVQDRDWFWDRPKSPNTRPLPPYVPSRVPAIERQLTAARTTRRHRRLLDRVALLFCGLLGGAGIIGVLWLLDPPV